MIKSSYPILLLSFLLNVLISVPMFFFGKYIYLLVSVYTSIFFLLSWINLLIFYELTESIMKWSGVKIIGIGNFIVKNILFLVYCLVLFKLSFLEDKIAILIVALYYVFYSLLMAKLALNRFKI